MRDVTSRGETINLGRRSEARIEFRRFRLVVVECPDASPENLQRGQSWESRLDGGSIGSHEANDFVLEDPTVSRFHCEIKIGPRGAHIRDLESRNGTIVDGVRVESAFLREGSTIHLGRVVLRFELLDTSNRVAISDCTQFAGMVSSSVSMRACFGVMERAATCDATVLIEGETGTGKTAAAEAIHRESARRDGPFLVVDCSTLATNLIEDELFGHEKGAFTGAVGRRKGVFEEAEGGTIFLDEIGELPLDLQAKLLRVIESREVRRLGGNAPIKVYVRIMAATHKDLRGEMNAGKFRADLYYRLAVLRMRIPSLKERPEDIPMLAERLLEMLGAPSEVRASLCTPEFLAGLQRAAWPGNIRELRNHLERCLVFDKAIPIENTASGSGHFGIEASRPFGDERERVLAAFEREYVQKLLELHGGNVTRAAEGAQLARGYLHRLLKKHGIRND